MDSPRKRRRLSNKTNFQLASPPVTPQKSRVVNLDLTGGGKKLFLNTPPSTPRKKPSVYTKAKNLFLKSAVSEQGETLVGREDEASAFRQFLSENIENTSCNSLYISGPPGTGKSAQANLSLDHLMNHKGIPQDNSTSLVGNKRVRCIRINCMSINNPETIFHEIYVGLSQGYGVKYNKRKTSDDLFELLTNENYIDNMIVLLDEMDTLITKDQQVLYQLFNFASEKHSKTFNTRMILVGIANALDLTDKFIPRLKRNGLSPKSLQFLPYNAEEIKNIIVSKLNTLVEDKENITPLFQPAAIQLCCKKSASVTGDLRKAFDICYKSIELVERDAVSKDIAPKVSISHIAKVCSSSLGDNTLTKLNNHNLLQKAVLCCLFNYYTKHQKDLTINAFFDYYSQHLEDIDNLLSKVNKSEFLEIISALESSSVIFTNGSDASGKIIKPNVQYDDLLKSIADLGVLKRLLHS